MAYEDTSISDLRWLVTLVQRVQVPNEDGGTSYIFENPINIHADIQPFGAATFWGATQVENVSHRIRIRWQQYLDQTFCIIRNIDTPDGGTRTEIFRIRRIKELGGRKRFVELECQLEGFDYH